MYLLPRFAHPCVYVCVCNNFDPSLRFFLPWKNSKLARKFQSSSLRDVMYSRFEGGNGRNRRRTEDNAREGGGGGLSRVVVFRDPDIVLRAMPRAIITCRPLRGIVTNPPYGVVAGRTRNGRRMRVENRCYVTNRN